MRKKRILLVNEASYLNTGYANYGWEVMRRLYSANKYELAELACYVDQNDPRNQSIPWKLYPNLPNTEQEKNQYQPLTEHEFGAFRFEETCLDFKPDIVVDYRDTWMSSFIPKSWFKKYFFWSYMPTVDAEPQAEAWIDQFSQANAILTYNDWSFNVLKKQGGNKLSLIKPAPPGASTSELQLIQDKNGLKKSLGLPVDSFIIATVMRNQKRKLYPDLIDAFKLLLSKLSDEQQKKTFLYFHVSYPDLGWDIPRLIKESGISNKIYFTYVCKHCKRWFCSKWQDARTVCIHCQNPSAVTPNTQYGLSRGDMHIMNSLFDLYVQYANCLAKGTEIKCKDGWRPIENIKTGDMVWTHTNRWQKVINTFVHKKGDNPLDISVWSDYEKLTITSEHPIYGLSSKNYKGSCSFREYLGIRLKANKNFPNNEFIKAKDLKIGDMIAYPIDDTIVDIEKIDLAKYISDRDKVLDDKINIKYGNTYNRFIDVDEEFCKFLGLYVADGNSTVKSGNNTLKITSHINETKIHKFVKTMILKICSKEAKQYKYKNRNGLDLSVFSILHSKLFLDMCKKHEKKSLPDWVDLLPLNKQKAILEGLFLGDGYFNTRRNSKNSVYYTISTKLCNQIKNILHRLRINYNVRIIKNENNRKQAYQFEIYGNITNGEFNSDRHSTMNFYKDNIYYLQIKNINISDYNDMVYNIEVENDNSYTTRICNTHNSEAAGMPQIDAAVAGVPIMSVDYAGMSDIVKKLEGYAIKVLHLAREPETHCLRAIPDNNDFAEKVKKFMSLPESMRRTKGIKTRKLVEKYYNWDNTAKVWEDHFDSIQIKDHSTTWDSPIRFHYSNTQCPQNLNNEQFVQWILTHVAGRPDMINSYFALQMIRDLNWTATLDFGGNHFYSEFSMLNNAKKLKDFTRNDAVQVCMNICNNRNYWEQRREQCLTNQVKT